MSLVDRLSLAVEEGITLTHEDAAYTLNSNNKVYPTTAFVSALTELMDEDITSANLHSVWDNARTVRRIVNKLTDAETIEFLTRNRDIRLMYDRVPTVDCQVDTHGQDRNPGEQSVRCSCGFRISWAKSLNEVDPVPVDNPQV